jgi:hypothetical protein
LEYLDQQQKEILFGLNQNKVLPLVNTNCYVIWLMPQLILPLLEKHPRLDCVPLATLNAEKQTVFLILQAIALN